MTTRKNLFAAFFIAFVLTTPAFGGLIHSDSPAPAPTPAPVAATSTDGGATTNGLIHSDLAAADGSATDTITATAVTLVQLVLSLI